MIDNKKSKSAEDTGKCEEELKMATQLAPTPTLKGSQALNVIEQLKRNQTENTQKGINVLFEMFEKRKNG